MTEQRYIYLDGFFQALVNKTREISVVTKKYIQKRRKRYLPRKKAVTYDNFDKDLSGDKKQ